MKALLCFICLLGVARGEPDTEPKKNKEVRAAISEALKHEFKFEPRSGPDRPASDPEVTILPPFEVISSKKKEDLYQVLSDERKRKEEEKFSWTKGGTILTRGNMTLMFKYDPESNSFNILRFSF